MVYITSDPHFGHENIIKFCKRPYANAAEMNEALIANINTTVTQEDELWILGDFGMVGWSEVVKIMGRINCKNVHYIFGNHDKPMRHTPVTKCFKSMQDYKNLSIDGCNVVLFHFPILDWVAAHRGSFMLHGHCHETLKLPDMLKNKKILDIGVDGHNYKPWSFDEIKAYMSKKENIVYNHEYKE